MAVIEIEKNSPPMIAWDNQGWVRREKATYKNLRKHGFNHCALLSVLLLLSDILT